MEEEELELVVGKRKEKKPKRKVCKSSDEIDFEYRKATVGFMQQAGKKLHIPVFVVATAVHFLHKFYNRYDFKEYDRMEVAATCLFLACKIEESPLKLAVVLRECQTIQYEKLKRGKVMKEGSDELEVKRIYILKLERTILDVVDFQLKIEHPYNTFVKIVKPMKEMIGKEYSVKMAQKGWNFINDSLLTTVCIDYSPQDIAVCCFYLAADWLINEQKGLFKEDPKMLKMKWLKAGGGDVIYEPKNIDIIKTRLSLLN